MPTDPEIAVASCLAGIREGSDALADEVLALSSEAWDGPTNCPPWRMRDLVTHVVVSGEGFVASIRLGLAGSVEPAVDADERLRRQSELAAAGPTAVARALQAVTADFIGLYDGLEEPQLSAICFHRRGNRSVRWYAAHRLAEVAFHAWDVQFSRGSAPILDDAVAALLLPTLLESNAPRTYAAGLTPQRGRGERYLLSVVDDPNARWLVTIDADKLEARRGESGPADVAISGSASALALLVYGRADLTHPALRVDGDAPLAERFSVIYPRP